MKAAIYSKYESEYEHVKDFKIPKSSAKPAEVEKKGNQCDAAACLPCAETEAPIESVVADVLKEKEESDEKKLTSEMVLAKYEKLR